MSSVTGGNVPNPAALAAQTQLATQAARAAASANVESTIAAQQADATEDLKEETLAENMQANKDMKQEKKTFKERIDAKKLERLKEVGAPAVFEVTKLRDVLNQNKKYKELDEQKLEEIIKALSELISKAREFGENISSEDIIDLIKAAYGVTDEPTPAQARIIDLTLNLLGDLIPKEMKSEEQVAIKKAVVEAQAYWKENYGAAALSYGLSSESIEDFNYDPQVAETKKQEINNFINATEDQASLAIRTIQSYENKIEELVDQMESTLSTCGKLLTVGQSMNEYAAGNQSEELKNRLNENNMLATDAAQSLVPNPLMEAPYMMQVRSSLALAQSIVSVCRVFEGNVGLMLKSFEMAGLTSPAAIKPNPNEGSSDMKAAG